jgi:hypothetical protein
MEGETLFNSTFAIVAMADLTKGRPELFSELLLVESHTFMKQE